MVEVIDRMTDAISANVPVVENEYVGEDGLLHCSVCHKKTQTKINFLDNEKVVRCICDCGKKLRDAYEERLKQEELFRQKNI